jgi:hypothetical protein
MNNLPHLSLSLYSLSDKSWLKEGASINRSLFFLNNVIALKAESK